jgi:hypothetical protein
MYRGFHAEAPSMRVLRWVIVPLVTVHVILASISGYRAIVQIYRLDVRMSDTLVRAGTTMGFDLVTSGRTEADAQMDLVQGAIAETLAVKFLPRNANASYDPRPQRGGASVTLSPQQLARFKPGTALVRTTAYGRMQWLHTPPPTVRERRVEIAP